MSMTEIRPYFREIIKAVDANLTEWKDVRFDNIPQPRLHKSYHIEVGSMTPTKMHSEVLDVTATATVRLFWQGNAEPQNGIDEVLAKGQAIFKECLKAANRSTATGIKNVFLTNFVPGEYAPSNDNAIVLTMDFNLLILIDIS